MNRSVLAYNNVCRKVLSDKRILSYLLKITMEEYEKCSIAEIESLIKGNVLIKEDRKNYDLQEVVMVNLGEDDRCDRFNPFNELFVKNYSLEEKFKILKEEYGIEAYEETKGRVREMCNLGEGLVEKGMHEGIKKGEDKRQIANIKTLMETMNASYEEVTTLLKLNEKDKKRYMELIGN